MCRSITQSVILAMNGHAAKSSREVTALVAGSTTMASYCVGQSRLRSATCQPWPAVAGGYIHIGVRRCASWATCSATSAPRSAVASSNAAPAVCPGSAVSTDGLVQLSCVRNCATFSPANRDHVMPDTASSATAARIHTPRVPCHDSSRRRPVARTSGTTNRRGCPRLCPIHSSRPTPAITHDQLAASSL
ncbi:Uncharacterised protein [Mycobacteroides abscessus subsp. abscessus]|nr:Uncharacterised protein [Mycobacteroides abscessus subsp. abscessus]